MSRSFTQEKGGRPTSSKFNAVFMMLFPSFLFYALPGMEENIILGVMIANISVKCQHPDQLESWRSNKHTNTNVCNKHS